MTAKPKPMTKTISGRTTSDFIGIPRLRLQVVLGAGCTEGMDAVFGGGVSPRADTLAMRAGTSAKFDAYLSLTLSLPWKGGQSSSGGQIGSASPVEQVRPSTAT